MAKYKIESNLTTSIDFSHRSIPVPSISELSDDELNIVLQVASAEKIEDLENDNIIQSDDTGIKLEEEFVIDKHQEKTVNQKLDFDNK